MSLIDQLHPADTHEARDYLERRHAAGVQLASISSVGVAIIARNVEQRLPATLAVVDDLCSHFRISAVRVLTNDNSDDTAGVLERSTCRNLAWTELFTGRPDLSGTRERDRTVWLAEYRNSVRASLPRSDLVLVLDADLLEVTTRRLLAGLGDMDAMCWHAAAAQNLVRYVPLEQRWLINYDAFAFRPAWGNKTNYMIERSFHYDVRPTGSMPYRVLSAFGGACWYTGAKYHEAGRKYCGEHGCEHVPFNSGLAMGVSPSMSLIGFL